MVTVPVCRSILRTAAGMDKENTQSVQANLDSPSESDVFAAEPANPKSERDVFAGDEEFCRLIAESVEAAAEAKVTSGQRNTPRKSDKRLSGLQLTLAAGIIVTTAMLALALLAPYFIPAPEQRGAQTYGAMNAPAAAGPQEAVAAAASQKDLSPAPVQQQVATGEAVSLKAAHDLYIHGDYEKAQAMYGQLRENLAFSAEDALMRDFLQLKMALCKKRLNDTDGARELLGAASRSRSPAVAVTANYNLALMEVRANQYLRARMEAYQTLAMTDSVGVDEDWVMSVQRDCDFIIAQCLTRVVLALRDADKDLPPELWPAPCAASDPLAETDEAELRSVLASGVNLFNSAALAPKLDKCETSGAGAITDQYSGTCSGASIEEFLAKFAANADVDVRWVAPASGAAETQDVCRKRAVTIFMAGANRRQFVSTAAGCAGLLAAFDENAIRVCDPDNYDSLSEYIELLSAEAMSLWQRFLLAYYNDTRTPNAHFALGLLYSCTGRLPEAIGEYKLLTDKLTGESLAPYALMHSSRIKNGLKDYFGACQDLRQIIEQYPDSEFVERACLYLADATAQSQLFGEAAKLYSRVFYLTADAQLQSVASLGAARCLYNDGRFAEAGGWLERCIGLEKDAGDENVYNAYFLFGQTNLALGRLSQACEAYERALKTKISKEKYVETVSALAKSHIEQGNYVEALEIVETVDSGHLSVGEGVEMLILKASILRKIGLADKAAALLGERGSYISNAELKTKINFELARCHIELGELELAHRELTGILGLVEAGPEAWEVAIELAGVCQRLGQDDQAIVVCGRLLTQEPEPVIREKALKLLADCFDRQKDYDRAALVLLGRWREAVGQEAEVQAGAVEGKLVSQNR